MRLLVLEDDATLGPWLVGGLREEGHVVDWFRDGCDALAAASSEPYDALILDRMTPSLDGLSVLKALRAAKRTAPAIFLTAMDAIEDRVEGLDAGGDDYLVKPFAFAELVARIGALERRGAAAPVEEERSLRAGDVTLDLERRQCRRRGEIVPLNAKEFRLLEVLMRNRGRVMTRTMLLERVWDMTFDPTTSVVETHVSRLRGKLEKPFGAPLIRTIRGAGYLFDD